MSRHRVNLKLEVKGGQDDPLGVIKGIAESSEGIDSMLRRWIGVARRSGHSWQEIADALGVTRQAAWERFKDVH
jgi:hypothetical protein